MFSLSCGDAGINMKIEAIVQEAAQGTISSSDALNLRLENQVSIGTSSQSHGGPVPIPTALKNFSMSQKEKTLDEFVRDKWLSFTAEDHVGLGVRSFLDLLIWFRNNDVPSCEVCNEAGVKCYARKRVVWFEFISTALENCVLRKRVKEFVQVVVLNGNIQDQKQKQ
ncbi:hypothetical protein ABKV19_003950 [Rosa sericea]